MKLTTEVEKAIWDEYSSYKSARNYVEKWHEYDEQNYWENFSLIEKADNKIDLNATLHSMPGEILLKIAIDLGIDTPDFIPSIPTFKNELKAEFKTAYDTFTKAFKQIETDPSLAVGLANSALESIVKEILKDERLKSKITGKETLYKLVNIILKEFNFTNIDNPKEIKTIGNSLISACQAIEKLRSEKTDFHGKTKDDYLLSEPIYTYFIVNSVTTVGLFLNSYFKTKYPKPIPKYNEIDDLPF